MRARPTRKVTITTSPTIISDSTKPPPVQTLLYYATGGNAIALCTSTQSYTEGFPVGSGKPEFKEPDQELVRYAITDSSTQVLWIREYED